jgi:rhomboid family GlyGly-CTERM serine protease
MVRKREIVFRGQFITLPVIAFSILIYCSPRLSGLFIYHRQAILDGEIWRMFTAPLVHFSFSHIFWDTLVFGIAGSAVCLSGFPRFWLVCCLAAFIPGVLYLQAFPSMEYYGGLSGLSTGAFAYYCLCNIFLTDGRNKIWVLTLAVIVVKIFIETTLNEPVFANAGNADFVVLPSAHIVGCLGATVTILLTCPQSIFCRTKR